MSTSLKKRLYVLIVLIVYLGLVPGAGSPWELLRPAGAQNCPLGDLNEDCRVDSHDIRAFAELWLDPDCQAPDCEADMDGIPGVSLSDFAWLAINWLADYSETTLVINEFMAANNSDSGIRDEHGDYDDWIEIHNYGHEAVNIGGMYLIDDIFKFPFERWMIPTDNPDATTIPAGGYLVIWADEETSEGTLHANFKLSATDLNEDVCLFDTDRTTILDAVYNFNFPVPLPQNKSYGRFPDGNDNWQVFNCPTPKRPNKFECIDILISEIMYHPYHSSVDPITPEDIREEYIELFNNGLDPVILDGWRITNGVDFAFPNDVTIGVGEYLVVAADVNTFTAKHPGVTNYVGGWTGRLSNSGEMVELTNDLGDWIDRVRYADQGDWGTRELGPLEYGDQRGWIWSEEHDGGGMSLELLNPELPNEYGQNWAASLVYGGTPGTTNSVAASDIAPLILDVRHRPRIPGPNDPVAIRAQIIDELNTNITVTLHYRIDTSVYEGVYVYPHYDPNDYNELPMFDDGTHGDKEAGDGDYAAQIPPHPHGTIIEFFVEAADAAANSRTWPAPSYIDGTLEQVTNALYQVDETFNPQAYWVPGSQPFYYLIMTGMEWGRLEYIGTHSSLEGPDSQMNTTFICKEGTDMQTRYNLGVRNRGHGSRNDPPNNYRANFPHDRPWKGVTSINLNTKYTYLQLVGNAIFRMAGLAQTETTAVQVRINGQNLALSNDEMYGSYVHVEVVDTDFTDNHFPDDEDGNAYKCMRKTHDADLRYEGEDPDPYRENYFKRTNTAEDDWSDLIGLTYTLSDNTPDGRYVDEVNRVLDAEQWLRFIAVNVLLSNNETTLARGEGDDYFLYSGIKDPRFVLIQHDLDSIFGLGDNPDAGAATRSIFRVSDIPAMKRFIEHPKFVSLYYWHLRDLIDTTFSIERFGPFLDYMLGGYVPTSKINQIKDYIVARNAYVLSVIPSELTISSDLPQSYGYYITDSNFAAVYGTADAVETRSVLVNGRLADWQQLEGQWEVSETTGATAEILVGKGSVWKYLDDGSNQGTPDDGVNWFGHPDYDDSLWDEGPAELGYGDAADGRPEATVVESGPVDDYYITTYFRHYFDVNDASEYTRLNLRILRDDGAIVYLNGVEIARSNMPPPPPPPTFYTDYLTLASTNVFGEDIDGREMETLYYGDNIYANDNDFTNINPGLLQNGTNVLAVEIHQYQPTSADISFDLELTVPLSGEGLIPLQPGINRVIVQTFDGPNGTGNELETGFIDILYSDGDVMDISGTLSSNMILDAASGPWHVTGDIVVPTGRTLTIEPATTLFFEPATGITVQQGGRLVAEGTQYQRIRFTNVPSSASQWDGVKFDGTLQDNRLCFLDHEFGDAQGESTDVQYSRVLIDNVTWAGTDTRVLNIDHPTVICRNSVFPSIGSTEPLHGVGLSGSEQLIFDGCIFGSATGYNDIIDFTGGQRPGPIFQLYNSIFLGGGDDGPDLDGTDAHIEGNIFMNFFHEPGSDSTSNAVATGQDGGRISVINVARNVFANNEHCVLLKEDCFMYAQNNVFVNTDTAVISFGEPYRDPPREPGGGVDMEGNIFWNNAEIFEHFFQEPLPNYGPTGDVIINKSILPSQWHYLGQNDIDADPIFVDPNSDFRLKSMSPAIGTGAWGYDMGAYVPAGAAFSGEPDQYTYQTDITLTVGGPGITSYKYSINNPNGPWSGEFSVDVPIVLENLSEGSSYTVYAIGRNSAGLWQSEDSPSASRTWTIDTTYSRLVINEILANSYETTSDWIELYYDGPDPIDLTGMSLTDDPCEPDKFIISSLTVTDPVMHPGDYMVLYADLNDLIDHSGFALSNEGEGLYLYNKPADGGGLRDSIEFGLQIEDFSIGRIGYGGIWKLNVPTPGQDNIAQPLGDPAKLKINEWLANGEVLFEDDFIELYNPEPMPVDISNLYLTDNPQTQKTKQSLGTLSFMPPSGYTVFEADDQNEPGHLDFQLSADVEMIALFDAELNEIDKVIYGPQTTDVSQGRTPDGKDNIDFFMLPTPGMSNPGATIITVTNLIDINDVWSYDQSNTDLGTAWRETGYDDSSWPTGNALFYVEDDPLPAPKNTPLTLGYPTYYFRKHFNLDVDPNDVTVFEYVTVIDDGAVIYINGKEVSPRIGMEEDVDIYFDTYANRTVGDADYEGPFPPIPANYFKQGDNVIAVEVHQTNATSTDIVFGLELYTVVETVSDDSREDLLALLDGLRITEIMYHDTVSSDYDYIELQNIGDVPLDVNGVRFTNGIDFIFPPMTIDVGEYVVVVSDVNSFDLRYDTSGITIAGQYVGNLSNGGEKIVLKLPAPYDAAIMRFSYNDTWYPSTDGFGFGLEIIDATAPAATWDDRESWQPALPTPGN